MGAPRWATSSAPHALCAALERWLALRHEEGEVVPKRGKRKRRPRQGRNRAAERRAAGATSVGGLPLWVLASEGLLHPSTEGDAAGPRVRATIVELAHVDRLRADLDSAARGPRRPKGA